MLNNMIREKKDGSTPSERRQEQERRRPVQFGRPVMWMYGSFF
jgi:hypothetical protein